VRIDPLRNAILAGSVHRIATSATENQNDRTRVFPVDVYLEGNEPRLRPGMSATMTFTLAQAENTPSLSLSAVFSTAEAVHYVFIRKGETFEARAVEIGIADTRRVQVLSGLIVNDEVALSRPLEFEGEIPAPPTPVIKPKLPRRSGS
jgi:hypothetical protein